MALTGYTAAQTATPAAKPAAARAATAGPSDLAWPQAAIADPTTLGFTKAGLDALDARMKQAVADGDTAGMTIILLRHGQVADFKSFGQQTPNTAMALDSLFRIYSMSKPITGVALMQLYEQGKWQLDDPVSKHAPELANLKALTWDKDGKVVTDADGKPVLTTLKNSADDASADESYGRLRLWAVGRRSRQPRVPRESRPGVGEPRRDDEEGCGHPAAL